MRELGIGDEGFLFHVGVGCVAVLNWIEREISLVSRMEDWLEEIIWDSFCIYLFIIT